MDALLTTDGGMAALILGALLGMVVLFIGGSRVGSGIQVMLASKR